MNVTFRMCLNHIGHKRRITMEEGRSEIQNHTKLYYKKGLGSNRLGPIHYDLSLVYILIH